MCITYADFKEYLDTAGYKKTEIIEIIKAKPYLQWKEYDDCTKLDNALCPDLDFEHEINLVKSAERTCQKYGIEAIPQDFEHTKAALTDALAVLYGYKSEIENAIRERRHNCSHANSKYSWRDSHHDYYKCPDCGYVEKC